MLKQSLFALIAAIGIIGCGMRVPEPAVNMPGTPHVSWIIMSGDSDNADREFVCQSEPRTECVIPVSSLDNPVFSDVHVYYHGAGVETRYTGTIQIGFFKGSADAHTLKADVAVKKSESIMNQSVNGIVTSTPGTYSLDFNVAATVTDTKKSQPIREQVRVVVK